MEQTIGRLQRVVFENLIIFIQIFESIGSSGVSYSHAGLDDLSPYVNIYFNFDLLWIIFRTFVDQALA